MRKIFKKALCGALAVAMIAGLAGCGKKDETTADSLMAQVSSIDPSAYNACHLVLDASAVQDGTEAGISVTMDIEASGKSAHVSDCSLSLNMPGMALMMTLDAWLDGEGGYTYTKASMMGMDSGWTKSPIAADDAGSVSMDKLDVMWPEGTQFTLADRKKDEDYTVTWNVPAEALQDAMSGISDSEAGAMGGSVGINDDMFGSIEGCGCTAVFDKDTKAMKSLTARITGADIKEFELRVMDIVLNGEPKALTVPDEVLSAAEESGSDRTSGSFGSDDDFGGFGSDDDFSSGGEFEDAVYSNDGDGYDEIIDGLGDKLEASMPKDCSARITHYSDHAELVLDYYPESGDGWRGSATVSNFSDSSYGGAPQQYADNIGFYKDWYDAEPYDQGEDYTIFLRDGEMDYVCVIGDMSISASVYAGEDTGYDTMVSYVQDLLAMAGVN